MTARASAILLGSRPQRETGAMARLLTADRGLVAAYVAGGRGRQMRAVMVPGNRVAAEFSTRPGSQLAFARLELEQSRAALMTEPLPAAAIQWVCSLTAAVLPERQPYPALHTALDALLEAVAIAPSARGWVSGLAAYEALLLSELGYGGQAPPPAPDWPAQIAMLGILEGQLATYLLAGDRRDVMGARKLLTERLARIG
ncbi:recombination protein O N-terminal domain-containing protein [Porphyrobacter sp. YT40]|uniref:DNA repair protein RecO n=1 Tax=Porphyrobacter sp. YT40 TaxID=2547601 RepID=UPI0011450BD1|nr:recombination protein O N-terminal domain-containing protein [Porphyrobacter sp. YT40]QDH34512.1 DNA recombination protein RecO [Porphyrobacter sp. YT40]